MILIKNTVDIIIKEFNINSKYAGITGLIKGSETNTNTYAKIHDENQKNLTYENIESLPGVAIYNTKFLRKLDYYMNPFLKSDEEAELCFRIRLKNGILKRIKDPIVIHLGNQGNEYRIVFKKFFAGYFLGKGQTLKYSLRHNKNLFLQHFRRFNLYFIVIIWWILFLISLFVNSIIRYIFYLISSTILIYYIFKKKNIPIAILKIISWNFTAIGILIGIFKKAPSPNKLKLDVVTEIK